MTQAELEAAVSRSTGESVGTIRRRGFSIVVPTPTIYEPEPDDAALPQMVDWDQVQARRHAA